MGAAGARGAGAETRGAGVCDAVGGGWWGPGPGRVRRGAEAAGPPAGRGDREGGTCAVSAGRGPGNGRGAVRSPVGTGVLRGAAAGEDAGATTNQCAMEGSGDQPPAERAHRDAASRRVAPPAGDDGLGGDGDPGSGDDAGSGCLCPGPHGDELGRGGPGGGSGGGAGATGRDDAP